MGKNFFDQLGKFFGNSTENEEIIMSDDLLIDDVFNANASEETVAAASSLINMNTRAQVCRSAA